MFASFAATVAVTASSPPPMASVAQGRLMGRVDDDVAVFAGIPYAAPPVGDLRWAAARPAAPWSGVRQAFTAGPGCPQDSTIAGFAAKSNNEDCLELTVYSPARPTGRLLPVLVWLHGGGLIGGSGADYDGRALARRGNVVVTINYRLGMLGFLAAPQLVRQGLANLGLLDQRAALRWVSRNIAAFGGNPSNVTIFGQSGGADGVLFHVVSPGSAGLFHRAIIESAGYAFKDASLADAQAAAAAFLQKVHCTDLACLRRLPLKDVLAQQGALIPAPVIDGVTLPSDPVAALDSGRFNRVPLLIGITSEEYRWYIALLAVQHATDPAWTPRAAFDQAFGANAAVVAQQYALRSGSASDDALIQALTDARFACPAADLGSSASRYTSVQMYEFDDRTAPNYMLTPGEVGGAGHTSELLYLFPGFHGGSGRARVLNASQQSLSQRMIDGWSAFARNGRIDGDQGLAAGLSWPLYAAGHGEALLIGSTTAGNRLVPFAARHRCTFWRSLERNVAR